ncbi:MAG: ABC transporter ATP-binding protein, partial [Streptosporangiaceae bacterium]
VVVSHDRYFLERITDRVVGLLGDGGLSFLPGGIDQYLEGRGPARTRPVFAPAQGTPARAPAAPVPATSGAAERQARKELQRLERQIERLSGREAELAEQLAANATDYEKLTALGAELRQVQGDRAKLEERWLVVADEIQ